MKENYTIGIDFGTDSVRAILVETSTGDIVSEGFSLYGRWKKGSYCDAKKNQFRQHPLDHIESLQTTLTQLLEKTEKSIIDDIKAISIASTGSTPIAVNRSGEPLSMTGGFEENPNAMFVLWKDHTALQEAKEINQLAHSGKYTDYTKYVGGEYSSEWFWAKMLHIVRHDEKVRNAAFSWVEHCDWVVAMLTGNTDPLKFKRSRCAAGHKAMWHKNWNGLPPEDFWVTVDPLLSGIRERLYTETYTADQCAGTISEDWANKFGLPSNVMVGVGAIDAHMGAIGGEIKPNTLVKVVGTSTCDMVVIPTSDINDKVVKGICGQVEGSILPNMIGLEAGQSAFGDIYAWFNKLLMWPLQNVLVKNKTLGESAKEAIIDEIKKNLLSELSAAAKNVPIEETAVVALDWLNGRRTPNSNQALKGGLMGLTLSTDAPKIFRALVEATCFGSKKIMDRFYEEGVSIRGVIAVGGVAQKSDFVMQTLADILGYPIKVVRSKQTCALGAAMSAAVVAKVHSTFLEAQNAMGGGFEKEYSPISKNVETYKYLYKRYLEFGDFVERAENLIKSNKSQ